MNLELLLAAAVASGTPILIAAFGGLLNERAGVMNLGIEGLMLVGAVAGFGATMVTGSAVVGVLAALLASGLVGLLFAFLTITLRMNQVVSGLAITIAGGGLSAYFGKSLVGRPLPVRVTPIEIPLLSDIPVLGAALFTQDWLVYLSILLPIGFALYLRYTRAGLMLRALGDRPDVLDTLGAPVLRMRYFYVVLGSAIAGVGGAYLSIVSTPSWIQNMTAGRGWIAVALIIFASWRPLVLVPGAWLFGAMEALRFRMQIGGDPIVDPYFLNMMPYLATLIVLVVLALKRNKTHAAPTALGVPYDREKR